jgi:hypothetical protein
MPRKTKGDSMKLRARYSTATTVLAAALMAYSAGAIAQVNRGNPDERRAQKAAKAEEQVVENFPNATRQSPHQQATKQGGSVLHELVELYQAKNYAETLTKADALLATTDNAY